MLYYEYYFYYRCHSRQQRYWQESAASVAFTGRHEALDLCEKEDEIFIIGGALVYRQALSKADKMYITRVHHEFENADAFFPVVNWDLWEEVDRQEFPADEKNAYPYTFLTYVRKA